MIEEPFYIQWHITDHCNLRCRHCYQDNFTGRGDLGWEGLKAVADTLTSTLERWQRSACIHVTGGEPLLRPDWFEVLSYLDRKPSIEEIGLITNGLLIEEEVLERLAAIPSFKKLKISLDGASARVNDAIRPKGTFQRIHETLACIQEGYPFELFLMFTVMKSNFRDLPSLIRLCEEMGFDGLILERFIPWGRGRAIMGEVLHPEEWKEVLRTLFLSVDADRDEEAPLPFQAFQISFSDGDLELSGAPCVLGRDGVCVLPDGSVLPCRRFPVSIGNLLVQSFDDLWKNSKLLETLRDKKNLKGKCGACEIEECRGCRSLALALTGDSLAEDPHCGYDPKH